MSSMLTTVFKSAFLLTGVASAAMAAGMFNPAAQTPVQAPLRRWCRGARPRPADRATGRTDPGL
ncbi:hypothetical protein [Sphingomonas hankookensis]|uniref:hypothetical protein n=1 Tax=Sphingomonas hankookensis TaxID=563996 RepID=UPI003D302BA2